MFSANTTQVSGEQLYVDDVFSTYLYTGNGSTQTITNGIDLAGEGGMVWIKARSSTTDNFLFDTIRGVTNELNSNNINAEATLASSLTSFNSDGFSIGSATGIGVNAEIYTSWTFRKAPKFFDLITWVGTGSTVNQPHSLGIQPGLIFVKSTSTTGSWLTRIRTATNTWWTLNLNGSAGAASSGSFDILFTSSTISNSSANTNGVSYIAYIFPYESEYVRCGQFTCDGSGNATITDPGWEPQFAVIKSLNVSGVAQTGNWIMLDSMRGWVNGGNDATLAANTAGAESIATDYGYPTATGFEFTGGVANCTYAYMVIRRQNKPPTSGTEVFNPVVYTGTNVDNRLVDTSLLTDMVWVRQRDSTTVAGMVVGDRLRGQPYLRTQFTTAEVNDADAFDQQLVSITEYGTAFSSMNGFWCGNDTTASLNANTTSNNQIVEAFRRAPRFFDVVCYTGDGTSAHDVSHSLGVIPQLIIVKNRGASASWLVGSNVQSGPSGEGHLDTNAFFQYAGLTQANWTATSFRVSTSSSSSTVNTSGNTYVAYLFASLAGVSKVGIYTGNGGTAGTNGTSQTINCGFTTGARFVLIKRTDSTGDWYVFDTARGIVAGNDPYLLTNSDTAEVTTVDAVDTDTSGFVVNQTSGTDLNVTSATYLFLAIS